MNPFTKGRKVRAVRDTKSYGVGTPIPEGAVLEVARTNEVDAASLFNAIRPDGGEYALAKDDFEPADATPAPLDPSKVKAGDTVTLLVDPPDRYPAFTVAGETHSLGGSTVHLGGWRVDALPDYVTLTDHQPATEPEPATFGTATVEGVRRPGFTYLAGVAGHDGGGFISFLYPEGDTYFATSQFTDFVPDEARALPTREEVVAAIRTVDLTVGGYLLGRIADAVMSLLRGESR